MCASYIDGMKVVSKLEKGKEGQLYRVLRRKQPMIAKVYRKNKNQESVEDEYHFLKKGYELGISPKVYGYNVGTVNYIVMGELKQTIFEDIKKTGKLTNQQQTRIIKIMEILDENNLFHGDVSPLNFMTDDNGEIQIIDYGMSKWIDDKFIDKHGVDSNVKLGLTFFVVKTRKFFPDFNPKLITKKIFSKLDLKTKV